MKEALLTITDAASDALAQMLEKRGAPAGDGLRLGVRKGGCAGWQYTMEIVTPTADDTLVEGSEPPVFIAADSLDKISGCQLSYSDALSDAGFKITNPNAARSCGCGTSFETTDELEDSTYDPSQDGIACS